MGLNTEKVSNETDSNSSNQQKSGSVEGNKLAKTRQDKNQSGPSSTPKKAPLFRDEAVDFQNTRLDGNVLISQSITYRNFALFYALACLLIFSFMVFGTYTRKVTVVGLLEPESGLSKIYPTNSGRIGNLLVAEGDHVKKGQALAKVIIDSVGDSGGYAYQTMAEQIDQSIKSLIARKQTTTKDYRLEKSRLEIEIDTSSELLDSLYEQQNQLSKKNKIIAEKRRSLGILQKKGSISLTEYSNQKIEALDSELILSKTDTAISEAKHNLLTAKLNLKKLPLNHSVTIGEIDREISELRRQLTDTNMRHAYTITAPTDGVISALSYRNGDNISPQFPLLSILPEASKMQARIYLPSSSISFVHEGQDINIQYQALPVQRFGTYPGKIVHVSTSPVNPLDMQNAPFKFNEPVYLVTAEIEDQNIELEDSVFPIIPGMAISISLLGEEQAVYEWLLDPFWDIKGRIQ
jgi:membrane fusion protein